MASISSLNDLPRELIGNIFRFADPESLGRLAQVSRIFREIINASKELRSRRALHAILISKVRVSNDMLAFVLPHLSRSKETFQQAKSIIAAKQQLVFYEHRVAAACLLSHFSIDQAMNYLRSQSQDFSFPLVVSDTIITMVKLGNKIGAQTAFKNFVAPSPGTWANYLTEIYTALHDFTKVEEMIPTLGETRQDPERLWLAIALIQQKHPRAEEIAMQIRSPSLRAFVLLGRLDDLDLNEPSSFKELSDIWKMAHPDPDALAHVFTYACERGLRWERLSPLFEPIELNLKKDVARTTIPKLTGCQDKAAARVIASHLIHESQTSEAEYTKYLERLVLSLAPPIFRTALSSLKESDLSAAFYLLKHIEMDGRYQEDIILHALFIILENRFPKFSNISQDQMDESL